MTLSRILCRSSSSRRDSSDFVDDSRFAKQLSEVQNLKRFLFEEKVKFNSDELESINLGPLNDLRYRPYGRAPNSAEWKLLDEKLAVLTSYLNDELRKKIRIRELSVYFGTIPLWFLIAAMVTILFYFLYPSFLTSKSIVFTASYLISLLSWSLFQGGLGACAFLGTRVAMKRTEGASVSQALEEDADVTDRSVLKIRILLGCLFGVLLGLPFSNIGLDKLNKFLFSEPGAGTFDASGFALIVVPFMLGFSTNLVLAILDRSILSIRTFFGISGGK